MKERSNRVKTFFWAAVILFSSFLNPARAAVQGQTPEAVLQKANAAYRGGDYAGAASLYESLIQKGRENAGVHYDLGNAYFKQDRIGPAILQYEKAQRLAPRDRDIVANLEYAKGLLEYKIEDKRNWYLRTGEAFLDTFTQEEIGIVTLVVGLIFWFSWIIFLYLRPRESWGWKRKTLWVFTLSCLSLWALKGIHDARVQEAIVMKREAAVRYGPSYKDRVAFKLGEGMKVRVKKRAGEWSRVALSNGETGWMFEEEIGII